MGIYCRDWAEEASKKIPHKVLWVFDSEYNPCKLLTQSKNRLLHYNVIQDITEAQWVGAEAYDDKGDVLFLDRFTEVL